MIRFFLIVLVLLALPPSVANAGHIILNGGHAIVCKNPDVPETIESLDHYDAVSTFETIDLGGDSLSPMEKVNYVFKQVTKLDPARGRLYQSWANTFFAEAKFVTGPLPLIKDDGRKLYFEECHFLQAATQREAEPGKPRYEIAKDVWDRFDKNSQAALILHEIVYRDAIIRGQSTSILARRFVSFLISNRLHETPDDYIGWRDTAGFVERQIYVTTNGPRRWYILKDGIQLPAAEASKYCDDQMGKAWLSDFTKEGSAFSSPQSAIVRYLATLPAPVYIWSKDQNGKIVALSFPNFKAVAKSPSKANFVCTNIQFMGP